MGTPDVPATTSLDTAWQAVGPMQVNTAAYGKVTGRVTSVAIDPSDTTGNTVYLGTTGGGVWKSTNANASISAVQFTPLTDNLQAYSANAGSSATASISIGAVSVQPGGTGVVLAGTGDPNDASDSYYGSGLLRSADNGVTWSLVQHSSDLKQYSFLGEGFAGFAWSGSTPDLVVAAVSSSAEGGIVQSSTPGASVRGLYYSTDAGATWQMATLQDGTQVVQSASSTFTGYEGNAVTSVVWNPIRRRFYAAVRFHGYYESADGKTFTRLTAQPGLGLTTLACPVRPNTTGLTTCPIFRGSVAAQPMSGDLFALTVDSSNGDTGLYQDVCASTGTVCASTTVAWAKKLPSTPLENASGAIPEADYTLALAAVPAATAISMTDTLLFVGTSEIFRCKTSDANGCDLRNTTNATTTCATPAMVAPSQHGFAFQTNTTNTAAPLLFFGNDGGLWRSTDGVNQQLAPCSSDDATHFENLNGGLGSLAEVNGLSTHPTDGGIGLVALGALGSAAARTSASAATFQSVWTQMGTGYSANVAIDQAVPGHWTVQSGTGVSLFSCTKGTACTATDFTGTLAIGPSQVSNDLALPDAPSLLDPALNSNAIVGTCRVYRGPASGGTAWSASNAISAPLTGPANSTCSSSNGLIRSIAAGGATVLTNATQTSGSPVLYAGMAGSADGGGSFGGRFFRSTSANLANSVTQWTDVTDGSVTNDTANNSRFNPQGFDVSSIAVDPNDASGMTVYATVAGFNSPLVYRSTNGATSWLNVSANLPNAPANAVVVDPNNSKVVYVALDTGVYVTTDVTTCTVANSQCWSIYGTSLPNAPVTTLTASVAFAVPGSSANGVLRAGTYGRGIWQLPLITAGQANLAAVSFSPASLSFASQGVSYTSAAQAITVTNTGNTALSISRVSASANWIETDNCSGATIAANGTCTVQVAFVPSVASALSGTLTVFGNVLGGYAVAGLSGTGTTQNAVLLTPSTVTFADTAVRASSAATTIMLKNNSSQTATLQSPVIAGDFKLGTNGCGSTLAAGAGCSLTVTFSPTASGVRSGLLTLADNFGTHTVALSGNGTAGEATVTPTSVQFADTPLNGTSASKVVTVLNTGNGPLAIGNVTFTGDFSETADTCANTLLASAKSCTITLHFMPTQAGTRLGTLLIASNSKGDPASTSSVALGGSTPSTFSVVLTPTALDFGTAAVSSTSAVKNITISNTGTGSGAIGAAAVTGDYTIKANTCGSTLPAQTGCTVSIAFTPTASGTRTGSFTIADDAGTQSASLTGVGTLSATDTLSPLSLSFGATTVNTASATQTVLLTNSGDVALTLVSAKITSGDFTAVNGCGPSLAAHSSCGIAISFAPKSIGALTGTLEIDDVQRAQIVSLAGTAAAGPGVSLAPSTLSFATTGVGNATASQTVVLTNNGSTVLQVSSITTTGDFGVVAGGTCASGVSLAVGVNCSLQIAFAPRSAGARSGSLVVSASGTTQTTLLSGTGVDFTFASNGPASVTVATGQSAVFPLLLSPIATSSMPITFTCSGAPANAKCTVVSAYADLSATSTVTATVLTGTSLVKVTPLRELFAKHAAVVLAMLGPVGMLFRRNRMLLRHCSLLAAFGAAMLTLHGCGSSRHIPDAGTGNGSTSTAAATPSGTYNIVVTATAAGLTKQVPLTLIVTAQ